MAFAALSSADVVRHSLVAKIVDAYSNFDEEQRALKARAAKRKQGEK
jgi:phosphate starvation-inducible PhoH-like protein